MRTIKYKCARCFNIVLFIPENLSTGRGLSLTTGTSEQKTQILKNILLPIQNFVPKAVS
jgi:hypothetical protein